MGENISKGPIQVVGNDIPSLNDAFMQIQNQMDELFGLKGTVPVYDEVKVAENVDADGSTSQGTDFIKIVDSNGELLHGMGNI